VLTSKDLLNLTDHLNLDTERVCPGRGWIPQDFKTEKYIAYIDEFVLETPWRGGGLGSWLLLNLFHFERLGEVRFVFVRPDVLQYTDSGLRYTPPPGGRAAEGLFARVVKFYERVGDSSLGMRGYSFYLMFQVGFRRVGDSQFFCMGKRSLRPSDAIMIDGARK
jgi:GNAT superfamily N-acetyltransferase